MVSRRRTSRIALRLRGRWLRSGRSLPIEISDINADGLFVSEDGARTDPRDMPLGELQKIEVDLPIATVSLLVVPRYSRRSERSRGLGLEIFAAAPLDRNLWLLSFTRLRKGSSPG
jgi:hypothetical protein